MLACVSIQSNIKRSIIKMTKSSNKLKADLQDTIAMSDWLVVCNSKSSKSCCVNAKATS